MELRHLNFRLLDVFMQVVELQNISAAARKLHLTQPTISAQLRKLEALCGCKLLSQEGKRMLPTLAGEHLYRASGDVMRRMLDCTQVISNIRGGEVGVLKIAMVNTAQYVVPPLVAAFKQRYPGIAVELSVGNRSSALQRYYNNADDVYIFSHPPADQGAHTTPFMQNRLQLIAPCQHWAVGKNVSFAGLVNELFLVRELGSATRMVFDTWLAGQGFQLPQVMQIESNEAIRVAVAAGMGLAVISEHIVNHGSDKVARLAVEGFPLPGKWYVVSRQDSRNSHVIERFRSLVLSPPVNTTGG